MWLRLAKDLRCPLCAGVLECRTFQEERIAVGDGACDLAKALGVFSDDFDRYVSEGLLLCNSCRKYFAILEGVPNLLPYTLPLHEKFAEKWQTEIRLLPAGFAFPDLTPIRGERQVLESFSREWLDYKYDGVLWTSTYADQEAALLREIRLPLAPPNTLPARRVKFLEIGCGLGIITQLAQKNWQFDAVGVDLSLAAFSAARHFRTNPFLHFVQASAFYVPFARGSFDVIYSRGVLHHTYSTQAALKNVAEYCGPIGGLFVWLYGPGSTRDNIFRKAAYLMESGIRPVLGAFPSSWFTQAILRVLSLAYMAVNKMQRWQNPNLERYTFNRALHAARDRFSPRYAYRQSTDEVAGWCRDAGFKHIHPIDWRQIPISLQENYRRNVGIWAQRTLPEGQWQAEPQPAALAARMTLLP